MIVCCAAVLALSRNAESLFAHETYRLLCRIALGECFFFFLHCYWLLRGYACYWFETHPPEQSHSAVRVNRDPGSSATLRSSNRLDVMIRQGVQNIVHFEQGPLYAFFCV